MFDGYGWAGGDGGGRGIPDYGVNLTKGKGKEEGGGSGMVWRASRKGIEGESGLRHGLRVKVMEAPSLDNRSLPTRGTGQQAITKKKWERAMPLKRQ